MASESVNLPSQFHVLWGLFWNCLFLVNLKMKDFVCCLSPPKLYWLFTLLLHKNRLTLLHSYQILQPLNEPKARIFISVLCHLFHNKIQYYWFSWLQGIYFINCPVQDTTDKIGKCLTIFLFHICFLLILLGFILFAGYEGINAFLGYMWNHSSNPLVTKAL